MKIDVQLLLEEKKQLQLDWVWANKELKSKSTRDEYIAQLSLRFDRIEKLLKRAGL